MPLLNLICDNVIDEKKITYFVSISLLISIFFLYEDIQGSVDEESLPFTRTTVNLFIFAAINFRVLLVNGAQLRSYEFFSLSHKLIWAYRMFYGYLFS